MDLRFSTLEREYRQVLDDNNRLIRFNGLSQYRINRNICEDNRGMRGGCRSGFKVSFQEGFEKGNGFVTERTVGRRKGNRADKENESTAINQNK